MNNVNMYAQYGYRMRTNAESAAEFSGKLRRAATEPGVRRAALRVALQSFSAGLPAIAVAYDRAVAVIDSIGQLVGSEKPDESRDSEKETRVIGRAYVAPELAGGLPGAVWANKSVSNFVMPSGLCLLVGRGGVGKTPLAHALASYAVEEYGVVRVGEPFAGYTGDNAAAAHALAECALRYGDVVLDSIKDLLSSASGAAMKSGLSRGALAGLSTWSTVACELGSTVYVPVNASVDDQEVVDMLIEMARSNATMVAYHESGHRWRFAARTGEGMERQQGVITFKPGDLTISVDAKQKSVSGPQGKTDLVSAADIVVPDAFYGALRRAISPSTTK